MLVPVSWLTSYLEKDVPLEELIERLTKSGTSVEHVVKIGEGLEDLVVGEVLEVSAHPNADRLRLAKVSTGNQTYEVVCGAPNLAAGQRIVFAPVGSTVPVNMHDPERQPFTLTQAKIRGIDSQGMICSAAELGLGEDHAGILVLPAETPVGKPASEALGYPQLVLDVEVTTNRSDELSMIGIAREASTLLDVSLVLPEAGKVQAADGLAIEPVVKTDQCFRFMTQALEVTVGPSPWWLQQRLSLAGMRPVNNVVDVTNYVMLEYGQPLHAYDLAKLQGTTLTARLANDGEKLQTLDGVDRELVPTMLVITDEAGPVGIAGIMGGEASKIDEATQKIVLEAAVFDPVAIRRAANKLALRSEASRRYERGVDRVMTEAALDRAVSLLAECAGGQRLGATRDQYTQPAQDLRFTLSQAKLDQYVGKQVPLAEASEILKRLGFAPQSQLQDVLTVGVPSWRLLDIEGEEDLIEEVVRILGYDQVPSVLPAGLLPSVLPSHSYAAEYGVKERLSQMGWMEIVNPSLVSVEVTTRAGLTEPKIHLTNPLSADWTHLRESLLPGLLATVAQNVKRQPRLQLFELSKIYLDRRPELPEERTHVGLAMTYQQQPEQAAAQLKGLINDVLAGLGIEPNQIAYPTHQELEAPFAQASVARIDIQGQPRGFIGLVRPTVAQSFDVPEQTLLAEINLDGLLSGLTNRPYQPLPKFPGTEEDLSVIVGEDTTVGEVTSIVRRSAGPLLKNVVLLDLYRHQNFGPDKKSLTFHLTYQADDHTLSPEEVAGARQAIIASLADQGFQVRTTEK